jgi:hypothetical protein
MMTVLDLTPTPAAELRAEQRNADIKRRTAIVQDAEERRQCKAAAKKKPKPWFVIEREAELRRAKKNKEKPPPPSRPMLMFCDFNTLLDHYCGPQLPDDDAGREDVFIGVNLLIVLADGKMRAIDWVHRRAPWYDMEELERKIEKWITSPYKFTATTLGKKTGLTLAVRDRLKIKTIRAIDCNTNVQMAAHRRERDRERKAKRREEDGMRPQAESLSRNKPWLKLKDGRGMSRAAFFRHKRKVKQRMLEAVRKAAEERVRLLCPQYIACSYVADKTVSPQLAPSESRATCSQNGA